MEMIPRWKGIQEGPCRHRIPEECVLIGCGLSGSWVVGGGFGGINIIFLFVGTSVGATVLGVQGEWVCGTRNGERGNGTGSEF